ncbi:MAG: plasmid pRiA4b ORF-3 family protein [Spirochaetaceae bacterium]|jgi:hypothetical protein|nr:plasmid pRiA4b ORF-3 family protein [Spirochaetaceae bacterium]
MTQEQEEALYDFLSGRIEPFTLKEITSAIRARDVCRFGRLSSDIVRLITTHRLAFEIGNHKWITRHGYFRTSRFVISPSRVELLNGILVPGHRCLPFANPNFLPNEYKFTWNGSEILYGNTEADPEDLYPYYSIFGEEFAPQYIAQENPENENAFNADPYEDPLEVSIKTLDMRHFYRETGFVPGDRIVVSVSDWENSVFSFERVSKDAWDEAALQEWLNAAEEGFRKSFETLGVECTTEEQVAWAYFYGGARLCDVPAYSLEDFLYKKTDKIETALFGIESRFWYAGKEISDFKELHGIHTQSDETSLESMLFKNKIPISEYVVQSYVHDALFRNDTDIGALLKRIVPPSVKISKWDFEMLAAYIIETFDELGKAYSFFADQKAGPVRQRVAELHTAVIELSARLEKGEIDPLWLPKHAFIILSQIQHHAAMILENLDVDEAPEKNELDAIDNSLESMCDTFDDIKEMIDKSLDNYRRSNITLVKPDSTPELAWRVIQISIGGSDVWRRLVIPPRIKLLELHAFIQSLFEWHELYPHRFIIEGKQKPKELWDKHDNIKETAPLSDLIGSGFSEFVYEYGEHWTIKIMILAAHNAIEGEKVHCVAGENAAPPEKIEGPLRFRRFIAALESNNKAEREDAYANLGADFKAAAFNMQDCNLNIEKIADKLGCTDAKT